MFEELRIRRITGSKLTIEQYDSLPQKIKSDDRVISHLVECDPRGISHVPGDISKYVIANYDLFALLSENQKNKYLDDFDISKIQFTQETFNELSYINKMLVFKNNPTKNIKYFSSEERTSLIEKIFLTRKNTHWRDGEDLRNIYSDEEFENTVMSLSSTELCSCMHMESFKQYIIELIVKAGKKRLMELYEENHKIMEYLPPDLQDIIKIDEAGDSLGKIMCLGNDTIAKACLTKPYLIKVMGDDIVSTYMSKVRKISCEDYINLYNPRRQYLDYISFDELTDLFRATFETVFECDEVYAYISGNYQNKTKLLNEFVTMNLEEIDDKEKKERLRNLYKSLTDKQINPTDYYLYHRENYQISKLICDKRVVENNSVELIEEYAKTFNRDILIQILTNAYGQHVKDIFTVRGNLDILDLDSFCIFDKDIYDTMGIGFIHYVLNCNLHLYNYFIYQLSVDKELLATFKKYFDVMTKDSPTDIDSITELIEKFFLYKDVLTSIDYDNISDEMRENLSLYIYDPRNLGIYVKDVDDLSNYKQLRTERASDVIYNSENIDEIKNMIFCYMLNTDVFSSVYDSPVSKLSIEQTIKAFNIKNIVKNQELIDKMGLDKNDVAILLLICGIDSLRNKNELIATFESILNRGLNYTRTRGVLNKIKTYCTTDVKKNFMSREDLEKMEHKEVDGVKVVPFDGNDFTVLLSIMGLNLSSNEYTYESLSGESLLHDWLNREGGSNGISAAIASSDTSIYPTIRKSKDMLNNYMTFIFDTDVDIRGMGPSDISYTHSQRNSRHSFNYLMTGNNEFRFSEMDDFKEAVRNDDSDINKFSNEMAISRYKEDITNGHFGDRVMPIGLYVVGEINKEHLETAKAFNDYYKAHGLGEFMIVQVKPEVYEQNAYYYRNGGRKQYERNR